MEVAQNMISFAAAATIIILQSNTAVFKDSDGRRGKDPKLERDSSRDADSAVEKRKEKKKKKFSKHMAHVEISSVVLLPVPDFETTNVNA
jgi:hypothetical protein